MNYEKFGVSPAFLLSLFGEDFMPQDVVAAIDIVKELGFDEFQCEIVSTDKLEAWEKGGGIAVAKKAEQVGLTISQMVAHFMLRFSENEEMLFSDAGIAEMERVFCILDAMGYHGQVTVPIGPYANLNSMSPYVKTKAVERLREKMEAIAVAAISHKDMVAMEVQPGALISGGTEILAFINSVANLIGYNFDTGHAWASGDKTIACFPKLFGNKLYGTHLCDNDGVVNLSLAPGSGTIDWPKVITALKNSDYCGGYDLEIFTARDKAASDYSSALAYLRTLL